MTKKFFPMKACDCNFTRNYGEQTWLVTTKINGLRAVCRKAICQRNKEWANMFTVNCNRVPNNHIRALIDKHVDLLIGFDGEIAGNDAEDRQSWSTAIRIAKTEHMKPSNWAWYIFNFFGDESPEYIAKPFSERWADCKARHDQLPPEAKEHIVLLEPAEFKTLARAKAYSTSIIDKGLEGTVFTTANAPYIFGRNPSTKPWALKDKPHDYLEAKIVGFVEAKYGFGKTIPKELHGTLKGTLGALLLEAPGFAPFKAGTGFDNATAKAIWDNQADYLGQLARIKYSGTGDNNRPLGASYKGIRGAEDIDPTAVLQTEGDILANLSTSQVDFTSLAIEVKEICNNALGTADSKYTPTDAKIRKWLDDPNKTLQGHIDGHISYWLRQQAKRNYKL